MNNSRLTSTLSEGVISHPDEEPRILLVDDDPGFLELTVDFLESLGENFALEMCTDSDEVAHILTSQTIDCIVSDYDMPGLNGLALLRLVRKEHESLPFILFTGKGSEEIASEAITAGVDEYLQKGGGTEKFTLLSNRIRNVVGKYRAEQEVHRGLKAMDSALEGIGILDEDGYYLYVNAAYADVYETDPETMVGTHWERYYIDDEIEKFNEEYLPTLESKGSWKGRSIGQTVTGKRVPEEVAMAQLDDGGHVCIVRDLSDELAQQQQLKQEQEYLEAALNSLDDVFFVFDKGLHNVRWNDAFNEVTGYTDEEIRDKEPHEFFAGTDMAKIKDQIEKILAFGEEVVVRASLITKSGQRLPYVFSGSPVTIDGDIIGVCGTGRRQFHAVIED